MFYAKLCLLRRYRRRVVAKGGSWGGHCQLVAANAELVAEHTGKVKFLWSNCRRMPSSHASCIRRFINKCACTHQHVYVEICAGMCGCVYLE